MVFVGAIIGFIAGAGLIYWLMQQKIDEQKKEHSKQMRELREELERNHELRMQETIKSLQKDYHSQLTKETYELEKAHEARLQEAIKSIETQSQHPNKLTTEEVITPQEELPLAIQEAVTETPRETSEAVAEATQDIVRIETDSTSKSKLEEIEQVLPITDTVIENSSETTIQLIKEIEAEIVVEVNQVVPETVAADLANASEPSFSTSDITKTPTKTTAQNNQELEQRILTWKDSKQVAFISQLIQFSNYPDSRIRSLVALAVGEIAAFRSTGLEIQRAIPVLGKLSQDLVPSVRKSAIEALSNIQSEKVIPFLQKALRDSDSDVVKSANLAMNKFKFYRVVSTKKTTTVIVKKQKR